VKVLVATRPTNLPLRPDHSDDCDFPPLARASLRSVGRSLVCRIECVLDIAPFVIKTSQKNMLPPDRILVVDGAVEDLGVWRRSKYEWSLSALQPALESIKEDLPKKRSSVQCITLQPHCIKEATSPLGPRSVDTLKNMCPVSRD
jgi:hypothetical protein